MRLHHDGDGWVLWHGDCREVLAGLPDCSVDSVVTDPPYELGFMGKAWDASGIAYSVELWSECLRVLKPGGHLAAFGGTRTYHRMAVAIEDAGFEIRDSLHWVYGSGFPKSLDVSKAIDKAAGAEREVVGKSEATYGYQRDGERWDKDHFITAPATDAAKQWQGWGTALKPAHESIVLARKPLGGTGVNVLANVESSLRDKGAEGPIIWIKNYANDAESRARLMSLSSIHQQETAATYAVPADESETQSDAKPTDKSSETNTPHGAKQTEITYEPTPREKHENSETRFLAPTADHVSAAESEHQSFLRSITSTEAAPPTDEQHRERSISRSSEKDFQTITESFAGIATGLTGLWTTVRIDKLSDGRYVWPDGLPMSTAGGRTVASNVLEWGTGALNIDGARVAHNEPTKHTARHAPRYSGRTMNNGEAGGTQSTVASADAAGRWPANVIFDGEAGAVLDEQAEGASRFFTSIDWNPEVDVPFRYVPKPSKRERNAGLDGLPKRETLIYSEKAQGPLPQQTPSKPSLRANHHPTVKPLALMRWLVRLITPPGGTVLEPFAGSGTTLMAAIMEHHPVIGIELTDDYLPIIEGRVRWALNNLPEPEPEQEALF